MGGGGGRSVERGDIGIKKCRTQKWLGLVKKCNGLIRKYNLSLNLNLRRKTTFFERHLIFLMEKN